MSTPSWAYDALQGFEDFGDAELLNARAEVVRFLTEVENAKTPRWLSLIGKSGVGKTHLAKMAFRGILRFVATSCKVDGSPTLFAGDCFATTADKLAEIWRSNKSAYCDDASNADLLLLDDLGTGQDKSGFITDALYSLLSRRVGKWTIITSNLTLAQIAEIDGRLSDRMLRDGNRVVSIKNCISYALRRINGGQR